VVVQIVGVKVEVDGVNMNPSNLQNVGDTTKILQAVAIKQAVLGTLIRIQRRAVKYEDIIPVIVILLKALAMQVLIVVGAVPGVKYFKIRVGASFQRVLVMLLLTEKDQVCAVGKIITAIPTPRAVSITTIITIVIHLALLLLSDFRFSPALFLGWEILPGY